jgi:rare lipoprotein A
VVVALGFSLGLAGCSSTKLDPEEQVAAPKPDKVVTEKKPKDGKYYKDDGPPDVDEVDWRAVPDPRVSYEPINPSRNRPYEVFGVRYVPFDDYVPYRKQGVASWYGRRYHGRKTSSGEVYDMYAMSAAHTILPIPSYARVTRVDDGRSVIVRVNDRGPFLQERLIDLSYTAARKLGVVSQGTAEVIVEAFYPDEKTRLAIKQPKAKKPKKIEKPAAATKPSSRVTKLPSEARNYLQLGAFASENNAQKLIDALALPATLTVSQAHVRSSGNLHRVLIGPYPDKLSAERDLDQLIDAGMEALIKVFE